MARKRLHDENKIVKIKNETHSIEYNFLGLLSIGLKTDKLKVRSLIY